MNEKIALVIDDEVLIRMMLSEFLQDCGFTTYEAENGFEGLQLYKEKKPNIVILDLRMPVLDGFGFLKESKVSENDMCDVIVLTGHGGSSDKKLSMELGAKVFFRKPFEHDELVEAASKLVEAQLENSNTKK